MITPLMAKFANGRPVSHAFRREWRFNQLSELCPDITPTLSICPALGSRSISAVCRNTELSNPQFVRRAALKACSTQVHQHLWAVFCSDQTAT